jgi:hypothetical protein
MERLIIDIGRVYLRRLGAAAEVFLLVGDAGRWV